jgi:hypothetical protein
VRGPARGLGRVARDTRLLRRVLNLLPALVLVAGIAAFAATRLGGSNPAAPPKAAPVDPASVRVGRLFLATAVARRNLAAAYAIVAPDLKEGMSLSEWKRGTIPVVPYPVAEAKAQLRAVSSFTDSVLFQVTFAPRAGSSAKPGVYQLSERKLDGRWLVDGWTAKSNIGASSSK